MFSTLNKVPSTLLELATNSDQNNTLFSSMYMHFIVLPSFPSESKIQSIYDDRGRTVCFYLYFRPNKVLVSQRTTTSTQKKPLYRHCRLDQSVTCAHFVVFKRLCAGDVTDSHGFVNNVKNKMMSYIQISVEFFQTQPS